MATDSRTDPGASSLGHLPGERWAFDGSVERVFDDMLERSIPEYRTMRELSTWLARKFPPAGSTVVDLGCARGGAIDELMGDGIVRNFVGVECAPPMVAAARARFAGGTLRHPELEVTIRDLDLRSDYPPETDVAVVLAIFTLQFVPIEHRLGVVRRAFESLRPGGAMVVAEKIIAQTDGVERLFVERYHGLKAQNGYSREEIDRKALALEGVLVPVTARFNEEMLLGVGFGPVECVWRWCNFAMWVAMKGE